MEPLFSPRLSILEPEPFQNPRSRQWRGARALHKGLLNANAVIHPFSSEAGCFRTSGYRSHWGAKSFSSKNILSQQVLGAGQEASRLVMLSAEWKERKFQPPVFSLILQELATHSQAAPYITAYIFFSFPNQVCISSLIDFLSQNS